MAKLKQTLRELKIRNCPPIEDTGTKKSAGDFILEFWHTLAQGKSVYSMRKPRTDVVLAVLLLWMGTTGMKSQNNLNKRFEAQSPVYERIRAFTRNPVAYTLLPLKQNIELSAGYSSGVNNDVSPHRVFEGDKHNRFALQAIGYAVDSLGRVVSGMASYHKEVRYNTAWTNVADVRLFYPYLVADSIGGGYFSETYRVNGSYGQKINRLTLGAKFDYRGMIAYRKVDPRPRNKVSEINITVGALLPIKDYFAGAYLQWTNYGQEMGNKILKPYRKDYFFSMTGLGLYDHRLSHTESSYTCYYYIDGWKFGLHTNRNDNNGWAASIDFGTQHAYTEDEQLRNSYRIERLIGSAAIGYQWKLAKRHTVQLQAQAQWLLARGTENHYDTVIVHRDPDIISYEKSYSATKHELIDWQTQITMLYEYKATPHQRFWGKAGGTYGAYSEAYLYPRYAMEYAKVDLGGEIGASRYWGKSTLGLTLSSSRIIPLRPLLLPPPENILVRKMVYRQHQYAQTGYTLIHSRLSFQRAVSKNSIIGVNASTQLLLNEGKHFHHTLSLSMIF